MTAIVRNLPFFSRPTELELHGQRFRVKADQIVVWISISEKGIATLRPASLRLPAILDIGCNHNLVIRRDHLTAWSALHPEGLRQLRTTRIHGRVGVEAAANVWVHPNRPYRRDDLAGKPPYLLECPDGIVVTPGDPTMTTRGCRCWG